MSRLVDHPLVFGSDGTTIATVFLLTAAYACSIIVYRLYFHPLAQFPGPRLAAATQWVQTYYELRGDGGRFLFEIEKWHDLYGPVVRINPDEIHIRDAAFYDTFYSNTLVADRRHILRNRFGTPESSHFTIKHARHRQRRAALNPYFGQRRVAVYSPAIQRYMDRICEIVEERYARGAAELDLNALWGCYASDVVADYCFGADLGFIEGEGFRSRFVEGMFELLKPVHVFTEFPWIMLALMRLPDSVQAIINPSAKPVLAYKKEIGDQVESIRSSLAAQEKSSDQQTLPSNVLTTLLRSPLPPSELTKDRLQQEATGFIGAGVETVSHTLSVASFHILSNATILSNLLSELKTAIPDPTAAIPHVDKLQQLPYLTACVNETLRLSIGTSQRSPRVFAQDLALPDKPAFAGAPRVVPAGCAASMSIRDILYSPTLFPEPLHFKPSRWLSHASNDSRSSEISSTSDAAPRAPDGRPLTAFLVPYAKGPRNCVGMHLANAELYIAIATLVRRFGERMRLKDGVTRDSVDLWMDRFVPRTRPGAARLVVHVD